MCRADGEGKPLLEVAAVIPGLTRDPGTQVSAAYPPASAFMDSGFRRNDEDGLRRDSARTPRRGANH